jgi:hypothetical protein
MSERELEVLKWSAAGKTAADVACILAVAKHGELPYPQRDHQDQRSNKVAAIVSVFRVAGSVTPLRKAL